MAGVEEFKSFEHSVGNRVFEIAMKIIAYLLIILGLIFVIKNRSKLGSVSTKIEIQPSKK